jgi:hypothetical protein
MAKLVYKERIKLGWCRYDTQIQELPFVEGIVTFAEGYVCEEITTTGRAIFSNVKVKIDTNPDIFHIFTAFPICVGQKIKIYYYFSVNRLEERIIQVPGFEIFNNPGTGVIFRAVINEVNSAIGLPYFVG